MIVLEYALTSGEYVAVQCTYLKIEKVIYPEVKHEALIIRYDAERGTGSAMLKLETSLFEFIRVNGKELGA